MHPERASTSCFPFDVAGHLCSSERIDGSVQRVDGLFVSLSSPRWICRLSERGRRIVSRRVSGELRTRSSPSSSLGNGRANCDNNFDEDWRGTRRKLSAVQCHPTGKTDCSALRTYVEQSWSTETKETSDVAAAIPFRSYCDTFWDLSSREDENIDECQRTWVCADDQWQCRQTKQCIEKSWLDDSEWDCADASDEADQFVQKLIELARSGSESFYADPLRLIYGRCNVTHPVVCLSSTRDNEYICIGREQIGDRRIDCAGGIDERHTLEHCQQPKSMLGHHFRCLSTNTCIPFWLHCQPAHRCPEQRDDRAWCRPRLNDIEGHSSDFLDCSRQVCLALLHTCDQVCECLVSERRYLPDLQLTHVQKFIPYRLAKQLESKRKRPSLHLPAYPLPSARLAETAQPVSASLKSSLVRLDLDPHAKFYSMCNRGLAIISINDSIVCLCPPQYYGDFCQYHADRLSVVFHLDLSSSESETMTTINATLAFQLLVLFMFNNETLMSETVHLRSIDEASVKTKKTVHFPYPRSPIFRRRPTNRSDIDHSPPPYALRIELYRWNDNDEPMFVSVWQYPIIFDFLPVSRLAKVLRLNTLLLRTTADPCSSTPCQPNADCQRLSKIGRAHV